MSAVLENPPLAEKAPIDSVVPRSPNEWRDARSLDSRSNARFAFVGNCQMAKLAGLYRAGFAGGETKAALYINNQLDLTEADQQALRQADCVVWQVIDGAAKVGIEDIPRSCDLVKVPLVSAPFLWPFAGRSHPRNERLPYAENGPFDPELGDVFLNGLISQNISAEAAVERYLGLDLSTRTDLDRLFELWFNGQRRRDSACGYEIADFVAQSFRTEQVFLTPHHPNLAVFKRLAREIFRCIGCEPARIENVLASLWRSPFAPSCLPVHPKVARHFNLRWATEDQRYPIRSEGSFTFAEYVRRYMAYEWNEPLAMSLRGIPSVDPDERLERLRKGLALSPRSVEGHVAHAQILVRLGRSVEALEAAKTAVSCDPSHPDTHVALASCLLKNGQPSDAEASLRKALTIHPAYGWAALELARLLLDQRRLLEAKQVVQRSLAYHPDEAQLLIVAAKILVATEEFDEAEALLRHAINEQPKMASLRCELATVLTNKLRRDLVGEYKAIVDASSEDADVHCGMGQILMTFGRDADAEVEFRRAAKLSPTQIGYSIQLAECLLRQRRYKEIISVVEELKRSDASDARVKSLWERLQAALDTPAFADGPRPKRRIRSNEPLRLRPHVQ